MKSIRTVLATFVTSLLVGVGLVATPLAAFAGPLPSEVVAEIGDSFSHDVTGHVCVLGAGESGPFVYTTDSTLPPGITLDSSTGIFSGTFQEAGTWVADGRTYCDYTGSNGYAAQASYPMNTTFIVNYPPAEFTPVPALSVEALGGANCEIQVTGEIPEVQDVGSVKLIFESETGILELTLVEQAVDTPFTFTLALSNYNLGENSMVAAWDGDGYLGCSTDVDVRLGYRFRTAPIAYAEVLDTYATFDLPSSPFITPVAAGDGLCSVYLTGRFPTSGDRGTRPTVTVEGENGEVAVIPTVNQDGVFYVAIPLDDISEFDYDQGSLLLSGPLPDCGEMMWVSATIWVEGEELSHGTGLLVNRFCAPGRFDDGDGCIPAPAGSFVPAGGMTSSTLCPKGTYQFFTEATSCEDAPIGSYVNRKGATEPTQCPSGKVTEEAGSVSVSECYSLKTQAFTSLKVASKLKFGASVTIPAETDNRIPVTITSIGVCTQTDTTMRVKVGKVTRDVRAVRITAGSEAGTCSVNITNNGDPFYRGYTKNLVIKVSRTGK